MKLKCGWCEKEYDSSDPEDFSQHRTMINAGATYIWCLNR